VAVASGFHAPTALPLLHSDTPLAASTPVAGPLHPSGRLVGRTKSHPLSLTPCQHLLHADILAELSGEDISADRLQMALVALPMQN